MEYEYLVFALVTLLSLFCFLNKTNRNKFNENIFNNNIDSAPNIEIKRNAIEPEDSTETVFAHPIKKQNSFLNPNDGLGALKKGVVLDDQTYEYEVGENDSSNLTIIELGDETKEIGE
jgi:hypothetical protein